LYVFAVSFGGRYKIRLYAKSVVVYAV